LALRQQEARHGFRVADVLLDTLPSHSSTRASRR
jgi:hypothetical protein